MKLTPTVSWQRAIEEQINAAIHELQAAKVNPIDTIKYLKRAKRAIKAAIAIEEAL